MATNFPDSPSNGDTHTVNGVTYSYDGTVGVWDAPNITSSGGTPAILDSSGTPVLASGITAAEVNTLLGSSGGSGSSPSSSSRPSGSAAEHHRSSASLLFRYRCRS